MKNIRICVLLFLAAAFLFGSISCNSKTGTSKGPSLKKLSNGGEVRGPRSAENIEKNIGILRPRLDHYYKNHLEENPELQGTIELIFDVDAKGKIVYVNIAKSTVKAPLFEEEILTALSNHAFDEWDQGKDRTEVIYPLTFTPEKKEEPESTTE